MTRKVEVQELLDLLNVALCDPGSRMEKLRSFEELVGECEIVGANEEQKVALGDLAYDFAFYSADPVARREDPALIDDEAFEVMIRDVLDLFRCY